MSALAGFKANVYITATPAVVFTNIVLVDAGDHKTFTISDATKRYWDETQTITVQTAPDGSTWTTVTTGFTVQWVGGIIVFAVAVSGATPSCRVSASYMPYSVIARAKSIDISVMTNILDVSDFGTSGATGWKTKLASVGDATYKLSQWWIDTFYISMLATRVVVSAYSGANANQRIEGYAFIKDDSLKIALNSAIEESISFEADGPVFAILS